MIKADFSKVRKARASNVCRSRVHAVYGVSRDTCVLEFVVSDTKQQKEFVVPARMGRIVYCDLTNC